MYNLHPAPALIQTTQPVWSPVTMATPQHLRIINGYYNTCNGDAVFKLFPRLPTELRLHIWKLSIAKQRLIEIQLHYAEEGDDAHSVTTNALGKSLSNQRYIAVVRNSIQLHSKLLRVNREARQTALEFYRIHMPCVLLTADNLAHHLQSGDSGYLDPSVARTSPQPLYLSPEHDILYIQARPPAEHTLVSFIHDLRAYDPLGIGLLRLALEQNTISALEEASAEQVAAPVWDSFATTFSHLRDLIFMMDGHLGRAIMGPLIDVPAAGIRFNHALPIKPLTPAFDLAPDPRPLGQVEVDLACVVAFNDPHGMREQMRHVMQACGIHAETLAARERVLFAYALPSYQSPIVDARTAEEFLREEYDGWLRTQVQRRRWVERAGKTVPVETDEELERVARPAVGFWLFDADADAFGPIEEGGMYRWKRVLDLRGHWPELAVARLV